MRPLFRLFLGLLSHIPRGDEIVYRYCLRYVNYFNGENNANKAENGELRLLQEQLPKAKVVFDVGANIGDWSKLALKINPSISLHCFEPSRFTYNQLIENHLPSNVICNPFGLSSSSHQANLWVFGDGSEMNSLYRREGLEESHHLSPQSRSEVIELRTLTDYCSEKEIDQVDFLKVDIEGHELELFRGAEKLLSNYQIRLIQFEYGGCNIDSRVFLKDIFEFFSSYPKYRFYKILPNALRNVKCYEQSLDNFQYQNWVIINDGA